MILEENIASVVWKAANKMYKLATLVRNYL